MADTTLAGKAPSPALTVAEQRFGAFMLFMYASGILAHLWPAVRPFTAYTTDLLLLVIGGGLLYFVYARHRQPRYWYWVAGAYLFTFLMEALGVATGAVFGEYAYGATMRVQLLGVPLVIAINWVVLVLAGNTLSRKLFRQPVAAAAGAGIFIAVYDYFIEPLAIKLDYWQWATGTDIPLQNYLAWAVIAFLLSLPLYRWRIRFWHPLLLWYLAAQWIFFVVLNWTL